MMNFISPIQMQDSRIDELNVKPIEVAKADNTFKYGVGFGNKENEKEIACVCRLAVTFYPKNEAMNAAFEILVGVSALAVVKREYVDQMSDKDKSEVNPMLEANAVSFAYAKARSVVEQITMQTSLGKITLPAIDPFNFIKDIKDSDK